MAKDDSEETWEVEAVAGIKKNTRKKTVEVYIKWKGFPYSKCSWENLEDSNCDDLLIPFESGIKRLQGQLQTDPDSDDETDDPLDTGEYVVENVIGVQWNFENQDIEYYIKWDGWKNEFNNWEPEDNVKAPLFTKFFDDAVEHLKSKYEKASKRKSAGPRSASKRSARAATPEVSGSDDDDDEPVSKRPGPKSAKKPGPKSATKPGPASSKKPGPKSATKPGPKSLTRPGPKSATRPGPLSAKKPGPASRTNGSSKNDSDEEEEKVSNSNGSKRVADSDDESVSSSSNRRPGPKSRVGPASSKPGPASKKKPGPKSRVAAGGDGSDSD